MKNRIRIGINGFGRIGRVFSRLVLSDPNALIEIVAINDTGPEKALAHLLQYDSIHGVWNADVSINGHTFLVNGHRIEHFAQENPSQIPWAEVGVDLVLECTGRLKSAKDMMSHIDAGAPRVLLSAVAASEGVKTIVMGANHQLIDGTELLLSNASCTTNCAAPLVDVIDKAFSIENGYITTVHSYTGDQSLHDKVHTDLRRARAAALSIIPTSTGAAKAITRIFPSLDGRLGGAGIRVPVPNGSLTDVTYILKSETSEAEVNEAFNRAANGPDWNGYLQYTDLPLVSSDIVGSKYSCIFDSQLTSVIGKMVKVVGWYDNEMGYSARLVDLIAYWSKFWDSSRKPSS